MRPKFGFSAQRRPMTRIPVALLMMFVLAAVPAHAQDSGLLLGLRYYDNFRTLWITSNTGKVSGQFRDLLLPRKSGFWRVSTVTKCEAEGKFKEFARGEQFYTETREITFRPVGVRAHTKPARKVRLAACPSSPCVSYSMELMFLSPDYISYIDRGVFECGVHPDGETRHVLSRLDNSYETLSIESVFGPPAIAVLERAMETKRREHLCEVEATLEETSWGIRRETGRWAVFAYTPTHRLCGYGFDFLVPLEVPSSISVSPPLPFSWQELERHVPGARDAFASPDGRLVVVVLPRQIQAFRYDGTTLRSTGLKVELQRARPDACDREDHPFRACEEVMMAEWAVGPHVSRWNGQFQKYVKEGLLQRPRNLRVYR